MDFWQVIITAHASTFSLLPPSPHPPPPIPDIITLPTIERNIPIHIIRQLLLKFLQDTLTILSVASITIKYIHRHIKTLIIFLQLVNN